MATAPLASDGHVNCSPKGGDALRVIGPRTVVYHDLTGSGVETIAHLRENGRIVLMFCAFEDAPKIVRLHGLGALLSADHPEFASIRTHFPEHAGTRALIRVQVTRISDSCGFGVPLFEYTSERDALEQWSAARGSVKLDEYRREKNARSIDGLPGLEPR